MTSDGGVQSHEEELQVSESLTNPPPPAEASPRGRLCIAEGSVE